MLSGMTQRRLFFWLSAAAGYIGLGMLLGYAFSDQTKNTSLWLGIVLVLASALLLGMFISARRDRGTAAQTAAPESVEHSSASNQQL